MLRGAGFLDPGRLFTRAGAGGFCAARSDDAQRGRLPLSVVSMARCTACQSVSP